MTDQPATTGYSVELNIGTPSGARVLVEGRGMTRAEVYELLSSLAGSYIDTGEPEESPS
jgi:hypothetical protein